MSACKKSLWSISENILITKLTMISFSFGSDFAIINIIAATLAFLIPGFIFPSSHFPRLIFYPHSQKILFSKNYIVTTTKNRAYEIVFFSHTLPFPVLFITPLPWHPPYILCFFAAKKSLVSLTTTPFNANSAIIFGMAINPLKISAMVHTALTVMYGPINTAKI